MSFYEIDLLTDKPRDIVAKYDKVLISDWIKFIQPIFNHECTLKQEHAPPKIWNVNLLSITWNQQEKNKKFNLID